MINTNLSPEDVKELSIIASKIGDIMQRYEELSPTWNTLSELWYQVDNIVTNHKEENNVDY